MLGVHGCIGMTTFADPRARMRDALRMLLAQGTPEWDDASLALFRNRLLDETGSDARPLAELLLEAIRRGWRERLPDQPLESARWDALSSPFVMRWSAERFVQPEMARWAAETWGFALGVIPEELLRVAPPPKPPSPVTIQRSSTPTRSAAVAPSGANPAVGAPRAGALTPRATNAPVRVSAARPAPRANARATTRPMARGSAPMRPTSLPSLSPKFVRTMVILAGTSYLLFIARMAVSIRQDRKAERELAARAQAEPAPLDSVTSRATTSAANTAANTAVNADSTQRTSGVSAAILDSARAGLATAPPLSANAMGAVAAGAAPGVPSITRAALPGSGADSARMMFVEPARRASGSSVPTAATSLTPARPTNVAFDELVLTDGTRMVGRVDIVRSGTVVFRDMRTGLRHEVRKDDVEQIITEFGSTVRFRAAGSAPTMTGAEMSASRDARAKGKAPAVAAVDNGMRARGVAGRYLVRYGAATAVGSKECTSVWTRAPQTVDRATVLHLPNADTLVIAFDGGDTFPSNVDREGFFASTPRIMPDQARTSTALITRLTGRFPPDGSLQLTVSIVFFRRMRSGPDLACTVNVNATGQRESR